MLALKDFCSKKYILILNTSLGLYIYISQSFLLFNYVLTSKSKIKLNLFVY